MTIRTRLVMGYTILALLVALTAGSAALGFHDISVTVRERLDHYLRSWESSEDLLLALDAQQETALEVALDPTPEALASYEVARDALRDAAQRLRDSERPAHDMTETDDVEEHVRIYQKTIDELLAADDRPTARRIVRDLARVFRESRTAAQQLVGSIHEQLLEARLSVEENARRRSALLGALATIGLFTLVLLTRALNTTVLDRLTRISGFAQAIREGRQHTRLELDGDDELSALAHEMNRILDQHDALERRRKGQLRGGRELLIGLTTACGKRSVLLGPTADLVVYAGPLPPQAWLDALAVHLRGIETDTAPDETNWTGPGEVSARVQPLHRDERHVGWLVVIASDARADTA